MARSKILDLAQISERTGIPVATLRYYRAEGKGRGPRLFKLANRIVGFEEDIDTWIEEAYQLSREA